MVVMLDASEAVSNTGVSVVAAIRAELAGLSAVDEYGPAAIEADELSSVIASCQWVMSQARALQAGLVEELASRPELAPAPSASDYRSVSSESCAALELTAPLALTSGQAEYLVAESVQLVRDFPATHAALARGEIDERRARVMLAELGRQNRDVAEAVEAAVIGRQVGELNARRLRSRLKSLVHRLAPERAEERRARAEADRRVRVSPAEDGMAWVEALMRAEDAAALEAVLDAGAKALKRHDTDAGDPRARTCDQRRADVLAQLARTALATGEMSEGLRLGAEHRRLVAVQVTVPLTTLVGLSEEPGELAGYGPIPARVACELAAAGIWQWLGTDPVNGAVLSHGRTRYTPTHDLIEHVLLRDRTCKAPGCALPATRCDLDHVRAFADGGATCAGNLTPLCRKHHLIKHHGPFVVDQPEPGTLRWSSPTGNTTAVGPERVGPVHDPPEPDDPPF